MAPLIFALRIRLFHPSKPSGDRSTPVRGKTYGYDDLKRVPRRLDSGKVWERREQLGRQIRCSFVDYGERFHSYGKVSV